MLTQIDNTEQKQNSTDINTLLHLQKLLENRETSTIKENLAFAGSDKTITAK